MRLSIAAGVLPVTTAGLLLLASMVVADDTRHVRGRVLDEAGEPVADVRLGTHWVFEQEGARAQWRSDVHSRGNPEVRSDADGRFGADLYFRGRPTALVALDLATSRGAVAITDAENIDEEQVLTLRPLVRIGGTVEIAEPDLAANPVYIYAFDPRAPIAVARTILPGGGPFAFRFPPGAYKFTISAKDLQRVTREVLVEADTESLDMGAIDLCATNLAEHYGKPPPAWKVTEARGVSTDVELADYRGRWVLIEFWSYW